MDSCSQVAKSNLAGSFLLIGVGEGTTDDSCCWFLDAGSAGGLGDGVGFGLGGGEAEVEGVALCDEAGETAMALCSFASLLRRICGKRRSAVSFQTY